MKYKSGQPLSEQQIQMHNEKIAAMLIQAYLGNARANRSVITTNYVLLLDLLNKGEI